MTSRRGWGRGRAPYRRSGHHPQSSASDRRRQQDHMVLRRGCRSVAPRADPADFERAGERSTKSARRHHAARNRRPGCARDDRSGRGRRACAQVRAILDDSDAMGPGYITERVAGESLATRILREDQFAKARPLMAKQCGQILADIHRSTSRKFRSSAVRKLPRWSRRITRSSISMASVCPRSSGTQWAAENAPKNARHTVVHGDFRHGNFIVGADGIRCVLDWEIAHSGDPMEISAGYA